MIQISVVSGTYNRINYLRKMVVSARESIGGRIPYEFVIVDGGSTDGTIEWCKSQDDIVLVEQGELLGAVKAFNAGAEAAQGRYVVLANDDVIFIGQSILIAFTFMEQNPQTGIGCFFQDREGKPFHVEKMPAYVDGRRVSIYYGQVCIVPRWLGDEVGWWGDYLHTYGGDNELTANVVELGYHVRPVECACIHDLRAEDELRSINQGNPRELAQSGTPHPDTKKFYQKWSGNRPKLVSVPQISNRLKEQKRILYAPIYESGHGLQRKTKRGLFEALQDVGVVFEHDYTNRGVEDFLDAAANFQPHLIVLQLQDANDFEPDDIKLLRKLVPDVIVVSWNGDYHPNNIFNEFYINLMREMDHAGFALASEEFEINYGDVNHFYWQIGYEEPLGDPCELDVPSHDVVFLGNAYSDRRKQLGQFLDDLRNRGVDVGLYGNWPHGWANGENLYDFDAAAALYQNARIAISDQQWPDATGYVSNRLFQAMAAGGCIVLQERFDGMEEYLGLINGHHIMTWEDFQDLEYLIDYFLYEEEERKRIAEFGHYYMKYFHSFDRRVDELMKRIEWRL